MFIYEKWDDHGGTMETVSLDKKGRITIPKAKREELGLGEDDEFRLEIERGELRLKPIVRKQLKVKARRRWGREAFPKTAEALFADEE